MPSLWYWLLFGGWWIGYFPTGINPRPTLQKLYRGSLPPPVVGNVRGVIKKFRDWYCSVKIKGSAMMRAQKSKEGIFVSRQTKGRRFVNICSWAARGFVTTCTSTMVISPLTANQSESKDHPCVKLGKHKPETFEMIHQACVKNSGLAKCFKCHSCFRNGRASLEDKERWGDNYPTSSWLQWRCAKLEARVPLKTPRTHHWCLT